MFCICLVAYATYENFCAPRLYFFGVQDMLCYIIIMSDIKMMIKLKCHLEILIFIVYCELQVYFIINILLY